MKIYPPGVAVTVRVPFIDLNGDPVEPTEIVARVYDENGEELDAFVPPFALGDTEAEIVVPAILNGISGMSGARTIEIDMTTEAGIFTASSTYLVRKRVRLQTLKNSFATYERSLLAAADMVNMSGWDLSDDDARKVALIEAFQRLKRLSYRIEAAPDMDALAAIPDESRRILPAYWDYMTIAQWDDLPERFRTALINAQVAEANELLNGDTVNRKRQQGILSESIGESSMMFRTGKPLERGVTAASFRYVAAFLDNRIQITRA